MIPMSIAMMVAKIAVLSVFSSTDVAEAET
jgi:hypothetical protein